jgi:hypothetical protein
MDEYEALSAEIEALKMEILEKKWVFGTLVELIF